jgi:hypothetical protein
VTKDRKVSKQGFKTATEAKKFAKTVTDVDFD